jgi:putative SOS response-associated peptidase YedK
MCTNFTPTRNVEWAKAKLGVDLPQGEYPPEAYPGYAAPIVLKSHQTGRVASGLARFGLIPSWAKDDKISRHTYNARSETVDEKPSYRSAWRQRRYAIALLDNFYEPNYISGKAERWKIELASQEPFGIASLWDTWTDHSSGEVVTSFTMLTVNADEHPVMKQFHKPGDEKRTPVVLAPSKFDEWLSADQIKAAAMMNWDLMPELSSHAASKIQAAFISDSH